MRQSAFGSTERRTLLVSRNDYGLLKEFAHKLGVFKKCVEIRTKFTNLLNLEQYTHTKTNIMGTVPNIQNPFVRK
jgi:hypothetical protein